MPVHAFDHVNIHSEDPEWLVEWYEDVLGLRVGPRPNGLGADGIWLLPGDQAILHLDAAVSVQRPDQGTVPALEQVAFRATNRPEFLKHLADREVDNNPVEVTEIGIVQINYHDCDGNHVHVDFPTQEYP
ncbi:MAG: glyoxalase [Pseudomonadota bacterium]